MIIDAREIPSGQSIDTDLCIVGAGAAGIALALEFLGSSLDVLLLDSGGERPDDAAQALNEGSVTAPARHHPPHTFRRRGLGGSTRIWGGRCAPLDAIDFAPRPWVPDSGWPIGMADLLPFYPAANRICEAGAFAYRPASAFPEGLPPLITGFGGARFTDDALERFSCPTDFGRRYRARLAGSRTLRVLLHATVTELRASMDGMVIERVCVATLTGRRFTVRPGRVVLAIGGLEIPRLLLASRSRHAAGIGNAGDAVGRYYMCHLAGTAGRLAVGRDAMRHGYAIAADGTYCRRRLAITPSAQHRHGLRNIVMRPHHPHIADPAHRTGPLSALYLARRLISYEYAGRLRDMPGAPRLLWLRHAANMACDPVDSAAFLLGWLRHRTLAARKLPSVVVTPRSGPFSLDFHAEQSPDRRSRVTLTADPDALGMPRLLIDWRSCPSDLCSIGTAFRLLAEDLARSGCGRLGIEPGEAEEAALRHGAYGGHHIGTARMSSSVRRGVVDADCRVHGMRNLFIAGSAVFPTSGQANPTLTIVALALRLAAHLRAGAQRG